MLSLLDCLFCCFCLGCFCRQVHTGRSGAANLSFGIHSPPPPPPQPPSCALFSRPAGGPTWLDCRIGELPAGAAARHLFVGIRRADGLLHWELSPPLPLNQSINRLPAGSLAGLDASLAPDVTLVLRRLRQPEFSLAALADLPKLRHLMLIGSNLTCLARGALGPATGLVSLSLVDNRRLSCLQPGALAELRWLTRLRLTGSSRLLRLEPAVFCSQPALGLTELALELPMGVQPPVKALSRLPSLVDLRLSTSGTPGAAADDATALELLPSLAGYICRLPADRQRRLRLNGLVVLDRLLGERLQASLEDFCPPADRTESDRDCDDDSSGGGGGCSDGCSTDRREDALATTPTSFHQRAFVPIERSKHKQQQQQQPPQLQQQPHRNPQQQQPPHVERPNLAGTVLLTTSAFLAGVLVSLYCLLIWRGRHRRHLTPGKTLPSLRRRQRHCRWTPGQSAQLREHQEQLDGAAKGGAVLMVGFRRRLSASDQEGRAGAEQQQQQQHPGDSELLLTVQTL